jgi:hypothetical protein
MIGDWNVSSYLSAVKDLLISATSLYFGGACGSVVEALYYKPEGRGFETR